MGSTATLETLSFFRGFRHDILYLIILAIIVFAIWSRQQIMAAIKALTVFFADLLRRSERQPFRFLDLPPEVRNLVYYHHFARYRTPEYWNNRRGKKMLPDAILNVNRQLYEEAAHALYSRESISITIRNVANLYGDKRPFAGVIRRAPHALHHVPVVSLEIRCPSSGLYNKSRKHDRRGRSVTELEANTMTVCNSLANLPNLQTIRVRFFAEESPGSWKPRLPAEDCIVGLLKPLRVIRYANPGIVIEMPQGCPMSTVRLAQQQWQCPPQFGDFTELNEEYEEDIGHPADD